MSDLIDRILGFLPHRSTIWTAISLTIFMFTVQRLSDWVIKKVQLPWMEEKNQQQRKVVEKEESK
ncbi:hypothetical protein RJD24_03700 [Bacillaceae bacterium IKA-2]|nr:hypothetical protein RJD24_03700 [Bacillaceae bacterium IKA-2]